MGIFENFNFARFLFSLQYMWMGMLSIFIVIGVIILIIAGMNYLSGITIQRKNPSENQKS